MFDHIDFAVRDLVRSRAFYTAALAPLGIVPTIEIKRNDGREGTGFGRDGRARFWIGGGRILDGRLHVAFTAPSQAAVDAFHAAAVAAGGSDNGEPGPRLRYGRDYYAAFVIDPDGHNVEAVCQPEPA